MVLVFLMSDWYGSISTRCSSSSLFHSINFLGFLAKFLDVEYKYRRAATTHVKNQSAPVPGLQSKYRHYEGKQTLIYTKWTLL